MTDWTIVLVVVPMIIGTLGEVAKWLVGAEAGDRGWKGVYYVTYKAHAIIVGGAMGAVGYPFGVPVPEEFGPEIGGTVVAYAFSGAVAMVAYALVVGVVKNALRHLGARRGPGDPT